MRLLGLVIGALVILVSAISFAVPDLKLSVERSAMTPTGLYAITVLRIAIGGGASLLRRHRGHHGRSACSVSS